MEDYIDINKDWFFAKYAPLTPKRIWTMKVALNWFLQNDGKIIVETGTTRMKDDWGAGQSTLLFGEICEKYNKKLYTVDNDYKALEVAKEITMPFKKNIEYVNDDSLNFLTNFSGEIDLLYLDSLDCDPLDTANNIDAQNHQVKELKVGYDKLSLRCVIVLDDNYFKNGGKTKLTKEKLKATGWNCLLDYYQSVWVRN